MARPRPAGSQSGTRQNRPKDATPATPKIVTGSSAVYRKSMRTSSTAHKPSNGRRQIAQAWQTEAYRHVNICGEARYAASLYAAVASRAELGISKPQALAGKPVWVTSGPEVEALNELAPTVRDRSRLIRDYMTHRVIAGECYLIARPRREIDPAGPPEVWEIVAVTELRKTGIGWEVRFDDGEYIKLEDKKHPVIRMWNPDPENRREAWSPFRALLPTLREIEWFTQHIFTQVRSRLMSAGVWFIPDNLTFPPPPPDMVNGGAEAIATMNEAEQFMASLAASSMSFLEDDDVAFPTVVMASPEGLERVDQNKLIKFWSEIDDKAMLLRSDAVRRFALGMDMPPEQILGSSGIAVTGAGGSAGSVNHWGEWAKEEQTIKNHIEPGLDDLVTELTHSYLKNVVDDAQNVVGYSTTSLRLRQDRSKEALEWYDRGELKASVALRETGFDPEHDRMDDTEFRKWLLKRIAGGSASPEQVQSALEALSVILPPIKTLVSNGDDETGTSEPAPRQPGRNEPPSLREHPVQGPPEGDHEHKDAPFGALEAAAEVLVLRALEKAGNRLLNDGKRGKDRDRTTPAHMAHVIAEVTDVPDFDFSLAATVYGDLPAEARAEKERQLQGLCRDLYRTGQPYTRERLIERFGS